ncbi:hypothetical protein CRYUN_Cryun01aG0107900 [Craigia yunnanensis]
MVTDSSDNDLANPKPGTLRHAVIQNEPFWIIFSTNMVIKLKHELIFNSYKTVDGCGANVHVIGNGCLTLQGRSDGMQVTIAFNHFGQALVQRMPRCQRGYIHVVNNDFTAWEMYALGGSANPTINSQGNRYTAPGDPDAKEVTNRVETDEKEWTNWN